VSDKIEFHGKGESSSVVVENQELDQVDIKSEATGTYSLEYLSPAVKSLSSSGGSVKLLMSHNKPLMFEFRIGDSGRIVFFLAPRVSDWFESIKDKSLGWQEFVKGGYVYYINIIDMKTEDEWLKTFEIVEKAVNDSQKE